MELPDPRLEEIARLIAQDIQSRRPPRTVDLTRTERAQVDRRVHDLVDPPPQPPFGLPSNKVSPAGYIDDAAREDLERLVEAAHKAREAAEQARQELDEAITRYHQKGISLRTLGSVVGLPHTTVRDIVHRNR